MRSVALSVVVGAMVSAGPTWASIVMSANSPVEVYESSAYDVYTPGPSQHDLGAIASAGGSASAVLTPEPSVSAAASGKWAFHSSLRYYFNVTGAPGTVVPLIVYATLGVSRDVGYSNGSASIDAYGSDYDNRYIDVGPYDTVTSRSESATLHINIVSGLQGNIWIRADASVDNGGSASAFVDPTIVIDPAFAAIDPDYGSHYALNFSDGVVNGAGAVPEPAAWAMMLVGFGLIGARARRRSSGTGVHASV